MIGELRHQRLGDVPQRGVQLKRAGQPLPDALQQADPVPLALAAPARGRARHDHDAADRARRQAQRDRLGAHEDPGPVRPLADERPFPHLAPQYLPSQLAGPPHVFFFEAKRMQRTPGQLLGGIGKAEQLNRKRIRITQIALGIRHHHGRLDLLKNVRRR